MSEKNKDFDETLKELEAIVESMDDGSLKLEETIESYEMVRNSFSNCIATCNLTISEDNCEKIEEIYDFLTLEKKIKETKPDYIVILAWNLKEEIMDQMSYVREWDGKFVTLIPEVKVLE